MDIFKLFGTIAIENKEAKDKIKEVTKLSEEARDKLSSGFGNIGKAAATMGKVVGGALVGAGAVGGALVAVTENTMDYRTAMGKLDAAFTTSGHSANAARSTYENLASVLGDTDVAVEASNHLAKLTKNQKDLDKWTNICTGVFATFGDSLPIEGLTEAANETARVGQLTGPLADALNWASAEGETFGVTMKENTLANKEWNEAVKDCKTTEDYFNLALSQCTTEQERQQFIMNTLNGIYDEASQKYQEVNADVIESNKSQEKYNAAMARFGETAQPIVNAVRNGIVKLMEAVADMVAKGDFAAIETAIDSAFSWLTNTAIPAVVDFVKFLFDNKDAILAVISAVAAGFLAWNIVSIVQGVIAAVQAWQIATQGMTVAQQLLNLVMMANPIGLVITLIAALVAAFIYLWNNCEGFRQFFIDMWENIKTTFSAVVDWFSMKLDQVGQFFSDVWQYIKGLFSDAYNAGCKIVDDIVSGIASVWNSLVSWFSDLWNSLFGNLNANVNVNARSTGVHGSHADGLSYVPFDGYVAQLHEGERVLTKKEAREYNSGDVQPIKIIVQSVLDGKVIGETAYNYSRKKARAGGI